MKKTELIMGMPITVEVVEPVTEPDLAAIFDYFVAVDNRYSTYKGDSEISQINNGLPSNKWSSEMQAVLKLCEATKRQTNGYFDITHEGKLDPSGLVKGWAINNAANLLAKMGYQNFYIEAGGDIQANGKNADHQAWAVGIRNPFNTEEIVKIIWLSDGAVATSGTYIRGAHIYNPHQPGQPHNPIKSLTVVGPNIYDADRFATAAFAMGLDGLAFIAGLPGFEAYLIDEQQTATFTSGFENYVAANN